MRKCPSPQGPWLFTQKSHRLPGSGQRCIISRSHPKTDTFFPPKPFSPRRADEGLLICGDDKDTNEEILIQAKVSFFLFYVQIMQCNCFTVINIISGASQTAFTMQISRLQKGNQEESVGRSAAAAGRLGWSEWERVTWLAFKHSVQSHTCLRWLLPLPSHRGLPGLGRSADRAFWAIWQCLHFHSPFLRFPFKKSHAFPPNQEKGTWLGGRKMGYWKITTWGNVSKIPICSNPSHH